MTDNEELKRVLAKAKADVAEEQFSADPEVHPTGRVLAEKILAKAIASLREKHSKLAEGLVEELQEEVNKELGLTYPWSDEPS
jgi:hypothetical protein